MITETVSALTEPGKSVLEPIRKVNQQAIAAVEKLAARQTDSLKAYSDLGVGQLKAVAEVKDVEDLQTLMSKQVDVLRAFGECLMSDIKAVAQIGVDFVSQATKVGAEQAAAAPAAPAKAKAA